MLCISSQLFVSAKFCPHKQQHQAQEFVYIPTICQLYSTVGSLQSGSNLLMKRTGTQFTQSTKKKEITRTNYRRLKVCSIYGV